MSDTRASILVSLAWLAAGCGAATPPPPAASPPKVAAKPTAPTGSDLLAGDATVALATDCGYRLVVNEGDAHFTMDISGTSLRTQETDNTLAYVVDDLLVQVVNVTPAQIGSSAAGKSGEDLLRAHYAWESDYLAKRLGLYGVVAIAVVTPEGGAFPAGAFLWDMPLEDRKEEGVTIHRSWSFVTVNLGRRVVGLSAMAEGGLKTMDVMTRLATWLKTLKTSPARISPQAVAAELRAGKSGTECPEISSLGVQGIDRRLRFDGIARGDTDRLIRAAEKAGGVERQTVGNQLRYRNHVCRFEITYPNDEWKDFAIQDLSPQGCSANLGTPLLVDKDDREKITNAVVLTATQASAGFGVTQMQEGMVDAVKRKGARMQLVKKPFLDGGLQVSYAADVAGTHFVGEILTIQRGAMLYNIHFNSTRGTVEEGRKHLSKLLDGLRLDVP